MNQQIIFPHIPKTAGSSFIKAIVEPNIPASNMQTRYVAGILSNRLYPYLRSDAFGKYLLKRAKRHLSTYAFVGPQKHFGTSLSLAREVFDWSEVRSVSPQKKTRKRPSIQELNEFDPRIVAELKKYHQLDFELYAYAESLFNEQVKQAGLSNTFL